MKRLVALLPLMLALCGCTSGPAPRPTAPEPQAPAGTAQAETSRVITTRQVELSTGTGHERATLTVTDRDFTLALDGGQRLTLPHDFGTQVESSLTAVPTLTPPPYRDHLLVTVAVAGLPAAGFWIVRERTNWGSAGPDGVYVTLGDRSVLMRPPDLRKAPGGVGPDPTMALSAEDLDRDGTLEYILYG